MNEDQVNYNDSIQTSLGNAPPEANFFEDEVFGIYNIISKEVEDTSNGTATIQVRAAGQNLGDLERDGTQNYLNREVTVYKYNGTRVSEEVFVTNNTRQIILKHTIESGQTKVEYRITSLTE